MKCDLLVIPRVSRRPGNAFVVRGGLGLFYAAVPLDTYAFNKYPEQTVTHYDSGGNPVNRPQLYLNIISRSAETKNPYLHRIETLRMDLGRSVGPV